MLYEVLKNDFIPELEGYIVKAVNISGEYAQVITELKTVWILLTSLKEVKEENTIEPNTKQSNTNLKVNKTNVINSIKVTWNDDKKKTDVKEVLKIKSGLKQRNVKTDLESIEYYYNRLIELFIGSCRQYYDYSLIKILKPAIKEILKSDMIIKNYLLEEVTSILYWQE